MSVQSDGTIIVLNLSSSPVTDLQLGNYLSGHLIELDLSHCHNITDKAMAIIAAKCQKLRRLHLNDTQVTHAGIRLLGPLEYLDIGYCRKITLQERAALRLSRQHRIINDYNDYD